MMRWFTYFRNSTLGLCLLVAISGCKEDEIPFLEIKRIDEIVTEPELKTFLSIIDELPNRKVPELPTLFLPPPAWSSNRTKKVNDLLQDEHKSIEEIWSVDRLTMHLKRTKALRSALHGASMTPQQFVGFALAIRMAMARDAVHEDLDLDKTLKRGGLILQKLKKDDRVFSTLNDEDAYYVLQQVAWLPLVDRVRRLKEVPEENVALVRRHREKLGEVFPPEAQLNPLANLANVLNESSLPFEEIAPVGTDEHILWHRNQAHIGVADLNEEITEPAGSSETAVSSEPADAAPTR